MVKITILVDNNLNPDNPFLKAEHGFSAYVEYEKLKILCDTGASDLFLRNAGVLEKSIEDINFSVISHGHYDHSGGLAYLLDSNLKNIYLSDKIFGRQFYSLRHEHKRNIGTDSALLPEYPERFKILHDSVWLSHDIALVKNKSDQFLKPIGNQYLTVSDNNGERNDDFCHEQALVIIDNNQLIILSPCSHNGAANIITSCQQFTGVHAIKAFIGGLHFIDHPDTQEEVTQFIRDINLVAPEAQIYTGHCTGDIAKKLLSDDVRMHFFYVGAVIKI